MSEQRPDAPADPAMPLAGMPPPVPQPAYGTPIPPPLGAPAYGAPLPTTNTYAIIALVLAIMSFLLCPIVPAIFALVMAGVGKREITASGGRQTGEGMVTVARVLSWVNIGLATVLIIIFVIFVVFLAANASGISSVIQDIPTQGPVPAN